MRRRTSSLAGLVAAVLLLGGCAGMPSSGPVVPREGVVESGSTPGIGFDPLPPQAGDGPTEIVNGFLEAMKAAPLKTADAQLFLTADAQQRWAPEQRILTYADVGDPVSALGVRLPLEDVNVYDARGAWVEARATDQVELTLVREDDEWRIDQLPDALVVRDSWLEDWYTRVSLYFFDPTAQILVPEPVYAPRGDQFASSLVRGLLSPAPEGPARVTRTFFPEGLSQGLSVPISAGGIAEVSLSGDPDSIDEETAQRMLVQLVWTLRQEPRIRAVDVDVAGSPLPGAPTGPTQVNLDVGSGYDPNGVQSTADVFALREGRLVRGTLPTLSETSGPAGAAALGLRSIGVNLEGTRVAGVTAGGSSVVVAPVDDPDGRAVEVVSGGVDLLEPAWDFRDRIWLVDRAGGNARVLLVVGDAVREIDAPGITGRDVKRFLVSRDGSRFVAVVAGARGDSVVAGRVLHDAVGRVLRISEAVRLAVSPESASRIRDVGWRSPTTVSVLSDITDDLSQVRTVSVDGAPGEVAAQGVTLLRGGMRSLVSAPVPGTEVYALGGDAITDLVAPEVSLPEVPPEVTALTYVG